jgi:hypothetical protein
MHYPVIDSLSQEVVDNGIGLVKALACTVQLHMCVLIIAM